MNVNIMNIELLRALPSEILTMTNFDGAPPEKSTKIDHENIKNKNIIPADLELSSAQNENIRAQSVIIFETQECSFIVSNAWTYIGTNLLAP